MQNRTTLAKHDRNGQETFYMLTMNADLSGIGSMGEEMTQEQFRSAFAEQGMPEHEISVHIENARRKYAEQKSAS
jgi:hypothetical protein